MNLKNRIIQKLGGFTKEDVHDMEVRVQEAERRAKEAEGQEAHWRKRVGGWEEACTRLLSENKKLQKRIEKAVNEIHRGSVVVNEFRTMIIPEYQKQIRELSLERDEAYAELQKCKVDQMKKEREQ